MTTGRSATAIGDDPILRPDAVLLLAEAGPDDAEMESADHAPSGRFSPH